LPEHFVRILSIIIPREYLSHYREMKKHEDYKAWPFLVPIGICFSIMIAVIIPQYKTPSSGYLCKTINIVPNIITQVPDTVIAIYNLNGMTDDEIKMYEKINSRQGWLIIHKDTINTFQDCNCIELKLPNKKP
jgi:hypothetical protein